MYGKVGRGPRELRVAWLRLSMPNALYQRGVYAKAKAQGRLGNPDPADGDVYCWPTTILLLGKCLKEGGRSGRSQYRQGGPSLPGAPHPSTRTCR